MALIFQKNYYNLSNQSITIWEKKKKKEENMILTMNHEIIYSNCLFKPDLLLSLYTYSLIKTSGSRRQIFWDGRRLFLTSRWKLRTEAASIS